MRTFLVRTLAAATVAGALLIGAAATASAQAPLLIPVSSPLFPCGPILNCTVPPVYEPVEPAAPVEDLNVYWAPGDPNPILDFGLIIGSPTPVDLVAPAPFAPGDMMNGLCDGRPCPGF